MIHRAERFPSVVKLQMEGVPGEVRYVRERTCRIDLIESWNENDEGASYWQCTVCDETFSRRISDPFFPADFNYCPNCGAKVVDA